MKQGYRLFVYKADKRTKSGERFVKSYDYEGYSGNAMMDEIKYLKQQLYKSTDGWRLDFEPMTRVVRNLMSGELVEIDYRTPYSCDPSTEAYWSR